MKIFFEIDDQDQLQRDLWAYLVKYVAGFTCQGDGPHKGRLHAHHLNDDKRDNRLANGASLCTACHGRKHNLGLKHSAARRAANSRAHRGLKPRKRTREHNERIAAGVRRYWEQKT